MKTLVGRGRRTARDLDLPELQEALFAGQHSRNPQGLLDALLPPHRVRRDRARGGGDPCRGRSARRGTRHESRARSSSYVSDRSTTRHRCGGQACARARRTRRRCRRRDSRGGIRARAAVPPSVAQPGQSPPARARHRRRGAEQGAATFDGSRRARRRSPRAPGFRSRSSTRPRPSRWTRSEGVLRRRASSSNRRPSTASSSASR